MKPYTDEEIETIRSCPVRHVQATVAHGLIANIDELRARLHDLEEVEKREKLFCALKPECKVIRAIQSDEQRAISLKIAETKELVIDSLKSWLTGPGIGAYQRMEPVKEALRELLGLEALRARGGQ